jgi:hypothetical protein
MYSFKKKTETNSENDSRLIDIEPTKKGLIIGKGGMTIREITRDTDCIIDTNKYPDKILIIGTKENIDKVENKINSILNTQNNYTSDKYSQDGYSQNRYSQGGYSQNRYSQDRYSQNRYSQDRNTQQPKKNIVQTCDTLEQLPQILKPKIKKNKIKKSVKQFQKIETQESTINIIEISEQEKDKAIELLTLEPDVLENYLTSEESIRGSVLLIQIIKENKNILEYKSLFNYLLNEKESEQLNCLFYIQKYCNDLNFPKYKDTNEYLISFLFKQLCDFDSRNPDPIIDYSIFIKWSEHVQDLENCDFMKTIIQTSEFIIYIKSKDIEDNDEIEQDIE